MSTFAINPVHSRTVARARDRETPRRRRPGRPSGLALLVLTGIGILAVFGVLALTASLGAVGAAAAFLVTVAFVGALVALTLRLLNTKQSSPKNAAEPSLPPDMSGSVPGAGIWRQPLPSGKPSRRSH
jgi:hypothetical protein